jgi:hypothetical protein
MGSARFARGTAHAEKRQQVARPLPVVMGSAPFPRAAACAEKWQQIGATPVLLRWIRYGFLLSWTGVPRGGVRREYPLQPDDYRFASSESDWWIREGFAEEISEAEARKIGLVVSGFVINGVKRRVVVDYTTQNEVLGARKFKMDTLSDLAPQLRPGDALLKAYVQDTCYHLRLATTTGTPRHFVLGRPLRSATYRPRGHSGKPGRYRTVGPGNSRAVWY